MNYIFYIKIILIIILILLIFYFLNRILKYKEHMSMKNIKLNTILNENDYQIDTENYTIKKCIDENNCIIKKYESLHFNNIESHNLAKNKPKSNSIFMKNNIPVPIHKIIDKNNKDYYLNEYKIEFPCVLKPVDGMQGTDVNTYIKNKKQFTIILNKLLDKYSEIMYENQVYGDNYRIFVFNNEIMDVIKREQPFIIGDGINNIDKLIENKNKLQKDKNLFPTKNIDYDYILEQGYNREDILEVNKKIFITNTINFHNGANPVRIDLNNIPQINKTIFIKAHKLIGLECSGIDYMSSDITIPYNKNDGHIIEINDMVDTKIHSDANNGGDPNFLFNNILKSLINNL
jgi:cyanophycin synthetase